MGKAGKKRGPATLRKIITVLKAEDTLSTGLEKRKIVNLIYERYPSELGSSRKAVEHTVGWYLSMYRDDVFVNCQRGMWALRTPNLTPPPKANTTQHYASEDLATPHRLESTLNGGNISARASPLLGDEAEGSTTKSWWTAKPLRPRSVAIQGRSWPELVYSGQQTRSHELRHIGAPRYATASNLPNALPQSERSNPVLPLAPPGTEPSMTSPKRQRIAVNIPLSIDQGYGLPETDHYTYRGMASPLPRRSIPPPGHQEI